MTASTPSQVNKCYVFCEFPASKFLNHYNLLERNKLHIYLPPFPDLSSLLPQLLRLSYYFGIGEWKKLSRYV